MPRAPGDDGRTSQNVRKRPNQVVVDLGPLKGEWLTWCKSQGCSSSEALRQVVARLCSRTPKPVVPVHERSERPTVRREISLTPSEADAVDNFANSEGFLPSKWVVSLIRAKISEMPQFGQDEMEAVARSNMALVCAGRNLNQIAKALNANPGWMGGKFVKEIEETHLMLREHIKAVAILHAANLNRWKLCDPEVRNAGNMR